MKTALFPGSFDPITLGHFDVISRGAFLFDKIIIAIGKNSAKKYHFSLAKRMEFIRETFQNEPKIEVESYSGLTIDFCKEKNARFILRGLRNANDLEFEKAIAQANRKMAPEIETVYLTTSPEHSFISSSIVRDIIRHGGDFSQFVPKAVKI